MVSLDWTASAPAFPFCCGGKKTHLQIFPVFFCSLGNQLLWTIVRFGVLFYYRVCSRLKMFSRKPFGLPSTRQELIRTLTLSLSNEQARVWLPDFLTAGREGERRKKDSLLQRTVESSTDLAPCVCPLCSSSAAQLALFFLLQLLVKNFGVARGNNPPSSFQALLGCPAHSLFRTLPFFCPECRATIKENALVCAILLQLFPCQAGQDS